MRKSIAAAYRSPTDGPGGGVRPPETADERALAELWAELLQVERVGRHDNFFALGGHSLTATQLAVRSGRRLGVELPLREIFQAATLAELAERFGALRVQGGGAIDLEPIPPVDRSLPLPTAAMQESFWILDRLAPATALYNMPLAVRLRGELDVGAWERTLAALVVRHEPLRTHFVEHGGRPVQVVSPPLAPALPTLDFTTWGEGEREGAARRAAEELAEQPFRLDQGPLFRAALLKTGGDRSHLGPGLAPRRGRRLVDGGSDRGGDGLVRGLRSGRDADAGPPALQFADYAAWQRRRLEGERLEGLLAYARGRLSDVPPLALPLDFPRSAADPTVGATETVVFPPELVGRLKRVGLRHGTTLYMTLLAGFELLMGRVSGQRDFAVGSPIAGRTRPELESLVGCLINMLVLRAEWEDDPPLVDFLERVGRTTLEAYQHQELPFERLVAELNPRREADRHPLFQVSFSLENAPQAEARFAGLELDEFPLSGRTAKFELSFTAAETPAGLELEAEYAAELLRGRRWWGCWGLTGRCWRPSARRAKRPGVGGARSCRC